MFLIRHAESAEWARLVCHGTLDVPLSSRGVAQADKIARHFADVRLEAVYASPRRRARATADILAAREGLEPGSATRWRRSTSGRSREERSTRSPRRIPTRTRNG